MKGHIFKNGFICKKFNEKVFNWPKILKVGLSVKVKDGYTVRGYWYNSR